MEGDWLENGEIKEKDGWYHIRAHYYIPPDVWTWLEEMFGEWHVIYSGTNQRRFTFRKYEDAILFKMTWM